MVDVRFEPEKLKPPAHIDKNSVMSPTAVQDLINDVLGKAVNITWKFSSKDTYKLRFIVGAEAEVYVFDGRDDNSPIKTNWEMFLYLHDQNGNPMTVGKLCLRVTNEEEDIKRALYRVYNMWLIHRGQGKRLINE